MSHEELPKRAFYDAISRRLSEAGWFRLVPLGGEALLAGVRVDRLILTVGLRESSLYRQKIMDSMSLVGHTFHTMSHPDAPGAYSEVGQWLTPFERYKLVPDDNVGPGCPASWRGRTQASAENIAAAVLLAAPRFLAQPGTGAAVKVSTRHQAHVERLRAIASLPYPSSARGMMAVPGEWVAGAYAMVSGLPEKRRAAFARELATDAWQTTFLLGERD